ncbi:RDD family protein [Actinoallomurus iriomotensis]|uniref:RDD domain-containing protein n=1 Tax=Actinoallomurus iriomotensis TaxID=478107 RepID=A0A9W6VS28_9ACTN|nr:RDD family protein [Actinoallomurus iriomotensis]GLY77619.1 hypothetical protein Airi01_058860 [Actinoallomurus iriomotensis]
MTQPPDHPEERAGAEGAAPPPDPAPETTSAAPPPPAAEPYPAAPPIAEPYGQSAPPGITAELAGRWSRLFAAIIDGIIYSVIGWIIAAPFAGASAMYDNKHLGSRLAANGVTAIIAIIYFTWQHGKWGRTIGKRALGIRVVRAQDGGPIGYGTAAWRVLFTYLITYVTCGLGGLLDDLWILWDSKKQALHDKVVKTYVVKADGPDPYAGN